MARVSCSLARQNASRNSQDSTSPPEISTFRIPGEQRAPTVLLGAEIDLGLFSKATNLANATGPGLSTVVYDRKGRWLDWQMFSGQNNSAKTRAAWAFRFLFWSFTINGNNAPPGHVLNVTRLHAIKPGRGNS